MPMNTKSGSSSWASQWVLPLFLLVLSACGGGGGGGGSGSSPPMALSYSQPPTYTVGQAIAPLNPTVEGNVSSYSISPALPAGLSLNTESGVISGTPASGSVTPKTTYTVTASNSAGSTSATFSITINDVAPSFSYASAYYSFTAGVPAQPIVPNLAGGAVVSWTASPALPPGLTLGTGGMISGTPTAQAAPANYVVTAANSGGQQQVTLTLAVSAAPLLDVGHAVTVNLLRFVNGIVLSQDANGHWVLWNYSTGAQITSGDTPCILTTLGTALVCSHTYLPVDLEGSVVLVQNTASSLILYNASTGAQLGSISTQSPLSWWKLATDGSYIVGGNASGLTAWSTSGQQLFSVTGNYASATAFAAPGQVQVATGPAGQSVIATVSVPGGVVTVSPAFQGGFLSWFTDGSRFFTSLSDTVWVYSSNGTQQQILTVTSTPSSTNPAGEGNWFWTLDLDSNWTLYAVGNNTPQLTQALGVDGQAFASGTTLALVPYTPTSITIVALAGQSPTTSSYDLPASVSGEPFPVYAAASASQWVLAGGSVLFDGASSASAPRFLDYGQVTGIAGSATQFAVATASGQILYYNTSDNTLEGTIELPSYQGPLPAYPIALDQGIVPFAYIPPSIAISTDGSVLAAAANTTQPTTYAWTALNAYALPSGTQTGSVALPSESEFIAFTLSGSGSEAGEVFLSGGGGVNAFALQPTQVQPIPGGGVTWQNVGIQLSPDGTLTAGAAGSDTTNIYQNGALVGSVPGFMVGWLDNSHVLVANFTFNDAETYDYSTSAIFDISGTQVATSSVPYLVAIQVVGNNTVYSPVWNAIYSLVSSTQLWTSASGDSGVGAIAGSETVFASSHWVLAEPN
jgi:hypothetical protein